MNNFIKEMMEIGAWEDKAGSETERNNAIKAAEKLYKKHLSELEQLRCTSVEFEQIRICGELYSNK